MPSCGLDVKNLAVIVPALFVTLFATSLPPVHRRVRCCYGHALRPSDRCAPMHGCPLPKQRFFDVSLMCGMVLQLRGAGESGSGQDDGGSTGVAGGYSVGLLSEEEATSYDTRRFRALTVEEQDTESSVLVELPAHEDEDWDEGEDEEAETGDAHARVESAETPDLDWFQAAVKSQIEWQSSLDQCVVPHPWPLCDGLLHLRVTEPERATTVSRDEDGDLPVGGAESVTGKRSKAGARKPSPSKRGRRRQEKSLGRQRKQQHHQHLCSRARTAAGAAVIDGRFFGCSVDDRSTRRDRRCWGRRWVCGW